MKRLLLFMCLGLLSYYGYGQSDCPPDLDTTADTDIKANTLQASNKLTVNRKIGAGDTLKLIAEQVLELLPGFEADYGSTLVGGNGAIVALPPELSILDCGVIKGTAEGLSEGQGYLTFEGGSAPYQLKWESENRQFGGAGLKPSGVNILDEREYVVEKCNTYVEPEYPFILNGEEDVEVEVIPSQEGFTYQWSHNASLNQSKAKFSEPGEYSVTVTDLDGCVSSETFEVSKLSSVDIETCKGECVEIGVPTKSGFSYSWDLTDNTNSIQTVCPERSGSYILNITNAEGFEEETIMYLIKVSHSEIEVSPQPAFLCEGSSVTLSVAVEGSQNIVWSNGDPGTSTVVNTTGIYTATVTTSDCTITEEVEVISNNNCDKVAEWFTSNGFTSEEVDGYRIIGGTNITNDSTYQKSNSIEIINYANTALVIDDLEVNLEDYALTIHKYFGEETTIYITSSNNVCEGSDFEVSIFNEVSNAWNSSEGDYIVWMHVCMRDDGTAIFFSNEKFTD